MFLVKEEIKNSKAEAKKLLENRDSVLKEAEAVRKKVEKTEKQYVNKFVQVLNEKKRKIRRLVEEIERIEKDLPPEAVKKLKICQRKNEIPPPVKQEKQNISISVPSLSVSFASAASGKSSLFASSREKNLVSLSLNDDKSGPSLLLATMPTLPKKKKLGALSICWAT